MTGLSLPGAAGAAPLPPDDPVSVTLGHRFLSSRPQVIDDFSGSGLLPLLRMLARVRNLDGPDDIASGIPTAMSRAQAPYAEMGLLAAFFPLVAAAAVGAVRSARAGYAQDYPDSVRRTLDQQQRLIDALRHGNSVGKKVGAGESDATLQPLIDLHAQGVERFESRRRHRDKGLVSLLKHNLTSQWHHTPGNGALSDTFNKRAADIIAERLARHWRLDTEETSYQSHLLRKCEGERQVAKRSRTVRLRQHPASAAITALKSFRQEVFFATARDLARRRDPATQALFHDASGRRLKTLTDDERFAQHLAAHPDARAIHLRRHSEVLARHLQAVDRFGRANSREALTDLAHVKRDRAARHGPTPPAMRAA